MGFDVSLNSLILDGTKIERVNHILEKYRKKWKRERFITYLSVLAFPSGWKSTSGNSAFVWSFVHCGLVREMQRLNACEVGW